MEKNWFYCMNNIIWNLRDDIIDINNIYVNLKNNEGIKFIILKLLVFKILGYFNK